MKGLCFIVVFCLGVLVFMGNSVTLSHQAVVEVKDGFLVLLDTEKQESVIVSRHAFPRDIQDGDIVTITIRRRTIRTKIHQWHMGRKISRLRQ
jgi:hypothetical protein